MEKRKASLAADLVASTKYRLSQNGRSIALPGYKMGHAGVYFPANGSLLLLDSYLAKEEIEVDEDGDPIDLDEDGTHDPERIYLTFYAPGKETVRGDFPYRDLPSLRAFLEKIF